MKRISITIPDYLLVDLDEYTEIFAKGSLSRNRAAVICDLIKKHVPKAEH